MNTGSVALIASQTYLVRVRSAVNNVLSAHLVDLHFSTVGSAGGSGGTGGGGGGGGSAGGPFAESEFNGEKSAADPLV